MFYTVYTGVRVEGDAVVQRVGSATSEDLIRWRKHPKNPLIEVARRWAVGTALLHIGPRARLGLD